jgi:hypothetical protein
VETRGLAIELTLQAFKILPSLGLKTLQKHGVVKPKDTRIDPDAFYSQEAWLEAFEDIYRDVGPTSTFEMGRLVGGGYPVPPEVRDVAGVLAFLDVGYHLAHRLDGKLMFDPVRGVMIEGIGHYAVRPLPGKNEVAMTCDNPYPCDFDHGLVTAVAQRFQPRARTTHAGPACRKAGAEACQYTITW